MQIRPDAHLISGRASNFFLCMDKEGLTLIDAGMPKEQQLLFELLDQLGRQPSQLDRILITHADIDHAGSLAAIQAATGATVYAGKLAADCLQQGKSPDHLPRLMQWVTNTFFKYKPVLESCIEILSDGDELPVLGGLQAVATPGHTADHFSFFSLSTGVLFAGDAINTRDGRLQRTPKRITADENAANQSAIRLLELTPATIACGHGDPLSNHAVDDLMAFFNELRRSE